MERLGLVSGVSSEVGVGELFRFGCDFLHCVAHCLYYFPRPDPDFCGDHEACGTAMSAEVHRLLALAATIGDPHVFGGFVHLALLAVPVGATGMDDL